VASTDGRIQRPIDQVIAEELEKQAARRQAEERRRLSDVQARRRLFLAHHWPEHYSERCFRLAGVPLCRRCSALYPLGFLIAFTTAIGYGPWPNGWDPAAIWMLCLPASLAFVGEMLGWFRYSVRWQVGTTLVAAMAFGKALGYELIERWSSEFWGPIAIFGGLWFFASFYGHRSRQ
jgi:hypothetical protein